MELHRVTPHLKPLIAYLKLSLTILLNEALHNIDMNSGKSLCKLMAQVFGRSNESKVCIIQRSFTGSKSWTSTARSLYPWESTQVGELVGAVCRRHRIWNLRRLKRNKLWLWTAVDHFKVGILRWVIGDHSSETFTPLWNLLILWNCYFYVSDGNRVYPLFIPGEDHIVSKTYMTWLKEKTLA